MHASGSPLLVLGAVLSGLSDVLPIFADRPAEEAGTKAGWSPAVTLVESILIKNLGETHGPFHQVGDDVRIYPRGILPQFSDGRLR